MTTKGTAKSFPKQEVLPKKLFNPKPPEIPIISLIKDSICLFLLFKTGISLSKGDKEWQFFVNCDRKIHDFNKTLDPKTVMFDYRIKYFTFTD